MKWFSCYFAPYSLSSAETGFYLAKNSETLSNYSQTNMENLSNVETFYKLKNLEKTITNFNEIIYHLTA